MRKLLLAMGFVCSPLNANAALITNTYETTLDWVDFESYSFDAGSTPDFHSLDGLKFVWSVTYESTATSAHQYLVGENGLDELGKGDDAIVSEIGLDFYGNLSYMSDAVFDLSSFRTILNDFTAENNLTTEYTDYPINGFESFGFTSFFAGNENGDLFALRNTDWFRFQVDNTGPTVWAGATYEEGYLDIRASNALISSVASEIAVPGPSALGLLGVGLAGLFYTRRKASKA
ncbi:hypothetical protein [Hahella sp. CCB-MM4]|uniref:hypothetical protein n=1 Tax=Hahella sp. (strain CCB-MM4) TaxID=1926491 RepID=UPI00113FF3FB|nr:hypothetical protein [Hahella sp. CCB-MM4]